MNEVNPLDRTDLTLDCCCGCTLFATNLYPNDALDVLRLWLNIHHECERPPTP